VSRRYVIVGSGIAALAAAEAVRAADAHGRITLVSQEPHPFYSRPGLAYLLAGDVPERQLVVRTPQELRELRLERVEGRVQSLHPEAHELVLATGQTLAYDRLLLALGAASIAPDFPGGELDGVVRLDGLDDARRILALARRGHSAVVVGGGSTALELVDGLAARGLRTHYLMRGGRYWSRVLDPVESDIVEGRLEAQGVVLHHHTTLRAAQGHDGRLAAVETTSGERVPCDILAVAVGVRPRVALAEAAGLDVGRGIRTDEYLATSAPDVFAAGDVAQALDPATGESALDTLWSSASAMGAVAGGNMAGGHVPHVKRVPLNVTHVAGITTTLVGALGGADDPDLLTITRGQSERWTMSTAEWTLEEAHAGERLRVLVGPRAIVGAVVMGDQSLSRPLAQLVQEQVDVSPLRPALEAHPRGGAALLVEFIRAWERERHVARR
jgi:NADPH-dependent 2,4-dienoyl-CoA reductase/sulfur reductase-like enzyme